MEKLYCRKCGKELVDIFVFVEYETETGLKVFKVMSVCPDKKFWNGHTSDWRGGYNLIGNEPTWFYSYYYENGKSVFGDQ